MKTFNNFNRKYKIGDRVIVDDFNEFGYNIHWEAGTITEFTFLLKPMTSKKREFLDWLDRNKRDYPKYQVKLDEPYKGSGFFYITLPERCILCLEKDKDEYYKRVKDLQNKMKDYDPYNEETWEDD